MLLLRARERASTDVSITPMASGGPVAHGTASFPVWQLVGSDLSQTAKCSLRPVGTLNAP